MKHLPAIYLLLVMILPVVGETEPLVIQSATPKLVYVEAGGSNAMVILRGAGLDQLRKADAMDGDRVEGRILVRFGKWAEDRRELFVMAAAETPMDTRYRLQVGRGGEPIDLPVEIQIVPKGDARASQTTLQEISAVARNPSASTATVSTKSIPTVNGTVPSPLVLPANGKLTAFLLLGENLHTITEVRVRPSDSPPRYKKGQGRLPFEKVEGGIKIGITASPETEPGSQYTLDLMVGNYIAANATLTVGSAPISNLPSSED